MCFCQLFFYLTVTHLLSTRLEDESKLNLRYKVCYSRRCQPHGGYCCVTRRLGGGRRAAIPQAALRLLGVTIVKRLCRNRMATYLLLRWEYRVRKPQGGCALKVEGLMFSVECKISLNTLHSTLCAAYIRPISRLCVFRKPRSACIGFLADTNKLK